MTVLVSSEELIQYLYRETSPEKTALIEEALTKDLSLREKLASLSASVNELDKFLESPRTESVLNVLRYAQENSPASSTTQ